MGPIKTEHIRHDREQMLRVAVFSMEHSVPHGHSDLEVCYVLEGSLNCTIRQTAYHLEPGALYLTTRFQLHTVSADNGPATLLVFHLHPNIYELVEPLWKTAVPKTNVLQSGQVYEKCAALLRQCALTCFSDEPMRRSVGLSFMLNCLYTWLTETGYEVNSGQNEPLTDYRVNRMVAYTEEHHAEKITLSDLADLVGLSPCHVSHLFHRTVGVSFQEYLNRVRLTDAVRLLNETELPLLDICMETGLSGSHQFNLLMQKYYSMTVREYRRQTQARPVFVENAPLSPSKRYSQTEAAFILKRAFDPIT